jgi:hypothetical protein
MASGFDGLAADSAITQELRTAGPRSDAESQAQKKNYAEALSRALAQRIANELRDQFSAGSASPLRAKQLLQRRRGRLGYRQGRLPIDRLRHGSQRPAVDRR